MPAERLSMRKIREVLRLKYACGASDRVISRSVGIGRTAIAEYVRRAAVIGISWPIPEEIDDTALERKLFAPAGYNPPRSKPLPDWGHDHGCTKVASEPLFHADSWSRRSGSISVARCEVLAIPTGLVLMELCQLHQPGRNFLASMLDQQSCETLLQAFRRYDGGYRHLSFRLERNALQAVVSLRRGGQLVHDGYAQPFLNEMPGNVHEAHIDPRRVVDRAAPECLLYEIAHPAAGAGIDQRNIA
jgi:hypothetical protein